MVFAVTKARRFRERAATSRSTVAGLFRRLHVFQDEDLRSRFRRFALVARERAVLVFVSAIKRETSSTARRLA